MLLKLILAFTLLPIAEIYVLIKLGGFLGAINTILIVILTAIVGGYLARLEGLKTMYQIRANLEQGIMPAEEMFNALLIFAAGLVLLTPGFITDIFGLLLLVPRTRTYIKIWLRKKLEQKFTQNRTHMDYF